MYSFSRVTEAARPSEKPGMWQRGGGEVIPCVYRLEVPAAMKEAVRAELRHCEHKFTIVVSNHIKHYSNKY